MDGSELLDLLVKAATGGAQPEALPPGIVRFALEYDRKPDLAVEQSRIAAILRPATIALTPLSETGGTQAARFLVLQLPVSRTLSHKVLFEIANVLRQRLSLVSCEPDTGARVYFAPEAPAPGALDPESAVVDLWCWSKAPVPADFHWAPKAVHASDAWASTTGAGIVVAQPDTGVARHDELEAGAFDLGKSANILEGGSDPTDPLRASMANPGHGTATASVVVSRRAGRMTGSAPGATLVPIRCINDVKVFDGVPVAKAVVHAREVGCDIITMSLGGIYSQSLDAAISDAVAAGMIVLAAAGNCVGFVVYPASSDNVIAVAGVDCDDKPWIGSCSGSSVAISAPAENVYIARRKPDDGGAGEVSGGQGTSFAVALTAGVAALWLAHHGRDRVRAEAMRRGVTVQALFRSALRQSARRPEGWNARNMGAGVVDADKLLKLPLGGVQLELPADGETESVNAIVTRLAERRQAVDGFDWVQHGPEASRIAAEAAVMSRRARAGVETLGTGALRASAEVERTAPPVIRKLLGGDDTQVLGSVVGSAASRNDKLLRVAGKSGGGGVESTASLDTETARRRIGQAAHKRMLLDKLDRALRSLPAAAPEIMTERQRVTAAAESALAKLAAQGPAARLGASEVVGLESLVSLHDRPALRVRGGGIDRSDPLLGDWAGTLLPAASNLKPVLAAVGRIDLDGVHVGTGFVVAPGRIMTNRHVLEVIGEEFRMASGVSRWVITGAATINFADDGRGDARRFKIRDVVATGADRIDETVNFTHLDLAVLEVEPRSASGEALPDALPLVGGTEEVAVNKEFLLVGYPARPGRNALTDPDTGEIRDDVVRRLGHFRRGLFGEVPQSRRD